MKDRSFWVEHASVFFGMSILALSLIALIASILLGGLGFLPTFLSHMAAVGIAAFVATVFFSFSDVRDQIAGAMSRMFMDGDVVRHLSPTYRREFRRRTILQDLDAKVAFLPESILERLEAISSYCLEAPHIYNHVSTVSLTDLPDRPSVLLRDCRTSYVISCRHLKGGHTLYPLRFRQEITDPSNQMGTDILRNLEVRIGDLRLGVPDATITQRQSGGTTVTLVTLERDVELGPETHVTETIETFSSQSDPTEITYAQYPTKAFRSTLLYKDGMTYDVAWFKAWTRFLGDFPGREQVELMPRGITAYTQEWLLPGHGAILYWFPKP